MVSMFTEATSHSSKPCSSDLACATCTATPCTQGSLRGLPHLQASWLVGRLRHLHVLSLSTRPFDRFAAPGAGQQVPARPGERHSPATPGASTPCFTRDPKPTNSCCTSRSITSSIPAPCPAGSSEASRQMKLKRQQAVSGLDQIFRELSKGHLN